MAQGSKAKKRELQAALQKLQAQLLVASDSDEENNSGNEDSRNVATNVDGDDDGDDDGNDDGDDDGGDGDGDGAGNGNDNGTPYMNDRRPQYTDLCSTGTTLDPQLRGADRQGEDQAGDEASLLPATAQAGSIEPPPTVLDHRGLAIRWTVPACYNQMGVSKAIWNKWRAAARKHFVIARCAETTSGGLIKNVQWDKVSDSRKRKSVNALHAQFPELMKASGYWATYYIFRTICHNKTALATPSVSQKREKRRVTTTAKKRKKRTVDATAGASSAQGNLAIDSPPSVSGSAAVNVSREQSRFSRVYADLIAVATASGHDARQLGVTRSRPAEQSPNPFADDLSSQDDEGPGSISEEDSSDGQGSTGYNQGGQGDQDDWFPEQAVIGQDDAQGAYRQEGSRHPPTPVSHPARDSRRSPRQQQRFGVRLHEREQRHRVRPSNSNSSRQSAIGNRQGSSTPRLSASRVVISRQPHSNFATVRQALRSRAQPNRKGSPVAAAGRSAAASVSASRHHSNASDAVIQPHTPRSMRNASVSFNTV